MIDIAQLIHDLRCCADAARDCNDCSRDEEHCYIKLYIDAADALEQLQAENAALKEQTRWRDAKKELPPQPEPNKYLEGKPLGLYLVAYLGEFPFRAFWNGKSFADGMSEFAPDFWMPLPELPEEVEK